MASQSDYRVTARLNGIEVTVVRLQLEEGLSRLYQATLDVYEERPIHDPISFDRLLDSEAVISLWQGDTLQRHIHGNIHRLNAGKIGKRRRHYQVGITADFQRLTLTSDCRIFQRQDVREIIASLLRENGLVHHQFDLIHPREMREYCVQYNESDFDFIHRLAAEEGIFYWFEHHKSHHVLHFGDAIERAEELEAPLRYAERNADKTEACIWQFNYQEQLVTAGTTQRDYTFHNPRYMLEHQHTGLHLEHQRKAYRSYRYNGRYKRDEQGKPFTRHLQEKAQNSQRLATLSNDYLTLKEGRSFRLEDHPDEQHNRLWISIENRLEMRQPQAAEEDAIGEVMSGGAPAQAPVSLTEITTVCIPYSQPWRPPAGG